MRLNESIVGSSASMQPAQLRLLTRTHTRDMNHHDDRAGAMPPVCGQCSTLHSSDYINLPVDSVNFLKHPLSMSRFLSKQFVLWDDF